MKTLIKIAVIASLSILLFSCFTLFDTAEYFNDSDTLGSNSEYNSEKGYLYGSFVLHGNGPGVGLQLEKVDVKSGEDPVKINIMFKKDPDSTESAYFWDNSPQNTPDSVTVYEVPPGEYKISRFYYLMADSEINSSKQVSDSDLSRTFQVNAGIPVYLGAWHASGQNNYSMINWEFEALYDFSALHTVLLDTNYPSFKSLEKFNFLEDEIIKKESPSEKNAESEENSTASGGSNPEEDNPLFISVKYALEVIEPINSENNLTSVLENDKYILTFMPESAYTLYDKSTGTTETGRTGFQITFQYDSGPAIVYLCKYDSLEEMPVEMFFDDDTDRAGEAHIILVPVSVDSSIVTFAVEKSDIDLGGELTFELTHEPAN